MVYISSSGEVLPEEPYSWKSPLRSLWKVISFVIDFFLTMVGLEHHWRQSKVNRYFSSSSSSYYGDDNDPRPGGGGGGGGRLGGGPSGSGARPPGGDGLSRRSNIHTLPRNSSIGVSPCAGGACGR